LKTNNKYVAKKMFEQHLNILNRLTKLNIIKEVTQQLQKHCQCPISCEILRNAVQNFTLTNLILPLIFIGLNYFKNIQYS